MHPVKASGWFNTEMSEDERTLLKRAGIVPVNDVFYDWWNNENQINLFYGGFGSSKSTFIQTRWIAKCRQSSYFRGYYGRKVLEDVRGSVHSKFIQIIKDYGLQNEFKFSEEPNGSMIIRHRNGNKMVPFGANNVDSLKSLDDPTDFFMEEMDQFTLKDFGIILSRLRKPGVKLQLYGAFNTAPVYADHWIRTTFFPDENKAKSEAEKEMAEILKQADVHKLFCNYTDNHFID